MQEGRKILINKFGNVKNLSYIVYNKETLTIKDTSEAQVKGTRLNGA
jgi:hypothetical protein